MILSDLFHCFGAEKRPRALPDEISVKKCVFCNISPDRFTIVLEDEDYVVFKDRSPAAMHHLLAVPRMHVNNVKSLRGREGAATVRELLNIGQKALTLVSDETHERRFGFHIPPFRSVEHLHLHCLMLPFKSRRRAFAYRVAEGNPHSSPPTVKGWSWFVTAQQATSTLEAGDEVKVKPCSRQ